MLFQGMPCEQVIRVIWVRFPYLTTPFTVRSHSLRSGKKMPQILIPEFMFNPKAKIDIFKKK
jgi:hypothetical protein